MHSASLCSQAASAIKLLSVCDQTSICYNLAVIWCNGEVICYLNRHISCAIRQSTVSGVLYILCNQTVNQIRHSGICLVQSGSNWYDQATVSAWYKLAKIQLDQSVLYGAIILLYCVYSTHYYLVQLFSCRCNLYRWLVSQVGSYLGICVFPGVIRY